MYGTRPLSGPRDHDGRAVEQGAEEDIYRRALIAGVKIRLTFLISCKTLSILLLSPQI